MQDSMNYWQDVVNRSRLADGRFFYAVKSTGIFCRPTCPAKRPSRTNVEFFQTAKQAECAGYRACKRCQPTAQRIVSKQELLVEEVGKFLAQSQTQPTLTELATHFRLSPYHLHRTFKRLTGLSPHQYGEAQMVSRLKAQLRAEKSITEAIYEAGYKSASNIYQRTSSALGMTPSQYKRGGEKIEISYATVQTGLGTVLVATTIRGVCAVILAGSKDAAAADLRNEFPRASINKSTNQILDRALNFATKYMLGEQVTVDLPLDLAGTAFQCRVWAILQTIPYGQTLSYSQVAKRIGQPSAARAVARACATNPAALIVPCHRVVREDGSPSGYRWGLTRKSALLEMESKEK